jgi:hypothetical protein
VGLENCGIGACSASGLCGASIAMITVDFAFGLAEGITTILTLGASASFSEAWNAAKTSLTNTFKKLSKDEIKKSVKRTIEAMKKMGMEGMINKMVESVKKTAW